MKKVKLLAVCISLMMLASCRIVQVVDEGGVIVSASGNHDCLEGTCILELSGEFEETFTGVPDPGYQFIGWEQICNTRNNEPAPCHVRLPPVLTAYDVELRLIAHFGPEPAAPSEPPSTICPEAALRWSDAASWPGGVPATGDAVTIPLGTHIGLDIDSAELAGLTVDGQLSFCERDLALTADWILVGVNGELRIGTEEEPFLYEAVITLTGDDPDEGVMGMGTRGIMAMGGALELHGNPPATTWTKINQHANVGTTVLVLDEAVDWAIDDEIVLAPTDFYGIAESEVYRLTAVDNEELHIDSPVDNFRWGLMQYATDSGMSLTADPGFTPPLENTPTALDERAEIGNLSRNIVIQSVDDALWQDQGFGAHVMMMTLDSVAHIDGVEFRRVGQAGEMGRYPMHWHTLSYDSMGLLLGDATGHYLRNSSIHNSTNRCITIHGTNGVHSSRVLPRLSRKHPSGPVCRKDVANTTDDRSM